MSTEPSSQPLAFRRTAAQRLMFHAPNPVVRALLRGPVERGAARLRFGVHHGAGYAPPAVRPRQRLSSLAMQDPPAAAGAPQSLEAAR